MVQPEFLHTGMESAAKAAEFTTSGAVNTMANIGGRNALAMTATAGAGLLGEAMEAIPLIGTVSLITWGCRKMYQGLLGGPSQTQTV